MKKWEYCAIFRIGKNLKGEPSAVSPTTLTYFLNEGVSIKILEETKDEITILSQTIASLGVDGWEMVGCGNTAELSHAIYFKRAIDQ
jgi:hypothetical protein